MATVIIPTYPASPPSPPSRATSTVADKPAGSPRAARSSYDVVGSPRDQDAPPPSPPRPLGASYASSECQRSPASTTQEPKQHRLQLYDQRTSSSPSVSSAPLPGMFSPPLCTLTRRAARFATSSSAVQRSTPILSSYSLRRPTRLSATSSALFQTQHRPSLPSSTSPFFSPPSASHSELEWLPLSSTSSDDYDDALPSDSIVLSSGSIERSASSVPAPPRPHLLNSVPMSSVELMSAVQAQLTRVHGSMQPLGGGAMPLDLDRVHMGKAPEVSEQTLLDGGGGGVVYEVVYQGQHMALKVMDGLDVCRAAGPALREALWMLQLRSKRVVQALAVYLWPHPDKQNCVNVGIVMPLATTDLCKYRTELLEMGMSERKVARLMLECLHQMAEALLDLHDQGVIHGDLKRENVFIDVERYDPCNVLAVKLADFGLTVAAPPGGGLQRGGKIGTAGYRAPEQLCEERPRHGTASDIWSVGKTLLAAMGASAKVGNGAAPPEAEAPSYSFCQELYAPLGRKAAASLTQLTLHCLQQQPQQRPTAAQVSQQLRLIVDLAAPRINFAGQQGVARAVPDKEAAVSRPCSRAITAAQPGPLSAPALSQALALPPVLPPPPCGVPPLWSRVGELAAIPNATLLQADEPGVMSTADIWRLNAQLAAVLGGGLQAAPKSEALDLSALWRINVHLAEALNRGTPPAADEGMDVAAIWRLEGVLALALNGGNKFQPRLE